MSKQDGPGGPARRRTRQRTAAVIGTLVAALLAGALLAARTSGGRADLATGDAGPRSATTTPVIAAHANRLASIAVHQNVEGGEDIVFSFAAALPPSPPAVVGGLDALPWEPAGIVVTTQSPDVDIHVCEARHFGWQPLPPETGSVDVFVPAAWMPPDFDPANVPIDNGAVAGEDSEPGGTPGKIVGCGPYEGYFQYSIWGPSSDDPEDVDASVTGSNHLVVDIRP